MDINLPDWMKRDIARAEGALPAVDAPAMEFEDFLNSARLEAIDVYSERMRIEREMFEGSAAVMVFGENWYVEVRPDGGLHLLLERDEWECPADDISGCRKLVWRLWDWTIYEFSSRVSDLEFLHMRARGVMDAFTPPGKNSKLSLDEWLHEHHDELEPEAIRLATEIMEAFDDFSADESKRLGRHPRNQKGT